MNLQSKLKKYKAKQEIIKIIYRQYPVKAFCDSIVNIELLAYESKDFNSIIQVKLYHNTNNVNYMYIVERPDYVYDILKQYDGYI